MLQTRTVCRSSDYHIKVEIVFKRKLNFAAQLAPVSGVTDAVGVPVASRTLFCGKLPRTLVRLVSRFLLSCWLHMAEFTSELPPEIIGYMMQFLEESHIRCSCLRVSKSWREIAVAHLQSMM